MMKGTRSPLSLERELRRSKVETTRELAFEKSKVPLGEPGLFRIAADVAQCVGKMIRVADQAVEVIFLPEDASSEKRLVDLPRADALPRTNEVFQSIIRP